MCAFVSCPDEIMQLDSAPLCATDIAPELKRQFAFLSGDISLYFCPLYLSVHFSVFDCSLHQLVFLYLNFNSIPIYLFV